MRFQSQISIYKDLTFGYVDEGDSRPPPVITDRPQNTTIPLTEEVELECKASGNPSPTIRWTHNRRPVLADSRISINRGNLRITGTYYHQLITSTVFYDSNYSSPSTIRPSALHS